MARYTGPTTKIARKFGEPIYGADKYFEKRNTPPGQHGLAAKRKKQKEYGTQLKEKQKVKYMYGVLERQFRNTYDKAARMKGQTGVNLRPPDSAPSSHHPQRRDLQHPFRTGEAR